ncbi:MAG: ornithine cyclodeaminase family protein [Devosiaceae bacterium]|nr:ornithine cyclodeaminase family protein [Devosiaceae bacterium MH13]
MRILTAADIAEVADFRDLIETLRVAFRTPPVAPLRHHHTIERPDGEPVSTLLIMPAWTDFRGQGTSARGYTGVKIVSVVPDNKLRNLPSVVGAYLLLSGQSGLPLALIDGQSLTLWRTASASALASGYLSRTDSSKLLMVGAGALAPYLIRAHCAVRPISQVLVWNRSADRAQRLLGKLSDLPVQMAFTDDLEGAVRGADIISCATMSEVPLIQGQWLTSGQHLDLVGAFKPTMREVDSHTVTKARVFCDTREGALREAGDLVIPIAEGRLSPDDVAGDLFDLCRGERAGRRFYDQITLFKSVGAASEDLAVAAHVFARA